MSVTFNPLTSQLDFTGSGSSGSLSIGDAVGSANARRFLTTDATSQVTDTDFEIDDLSFFSGLVTGKSFNNVNTPNAGTAYVDATGVGSSEITASYFTGGVGGGNYTLDIDTINAYYVHNKTSANLASWDYYAEGNQVNTVPALSTYWYGIRLGHSTAVNFIDSNLTGTEATLATAPAIKNALDTQYCDSAGSLVETNSVSILSDIKIASKLTTTSSGTLKSGRVKLRSADSFTEPSSIKMVVYSDNAGAPDALLATSDEITVNPDGTTRAWRYFTFSGANQIAIANATDYWYGIIISAASPVTVQMSSDNSFNGNVTVADTYADGPSDPFGTPTYNYGIIVGELQYFTGYPWDTTGYTQQDYEKTSTYVYVGYEETGGAWYIYRRTIATNTREYATGASGYAAAWTNRAAETYS